MENIVCSAEKVTTNDLNNNPVDENLQGKLEVYKVEYFIAFRFAACHSFKSKFDFSEFYCR